MARGGSFLLSLYYRPRGGTLGPEKITVEILERVWDVDRRAELVARLLRAEMALREAQRELDGPGVLLSDSGPAAPVCPR